MSFPAKGVPWRFPFEGCPGQAATRTAMRVHFLHRHVWDNMVILEEGNLPHQQFPLCDMLVPWHALNRRHIGTAQCARGADQKRRRLAEEELRESLERAFQAYGELLENVTEFRYLGRVIKADEDY